MGHWYKQARELTLQRYYFRRQVVRVMLDSVTKPSVAEAAQETTAAYLQRASLAAAAHIDRLILAGGF